MLSGPLLVYLLSVWLVDTAAKTGTYYTDYDQPIVAVLDNEILHCPRPIPVDLDSGVTAHEDEMACRKLLITEVRSLLCQLRYLPT